MATVDGATGATLQESCAAVSDGQSNQPADVISVSRTDTTGGVEVIEGSSPESIVSSQEVDSVPWWAQLLKQHTRHLKFNDKAAMPLSLASTCSGMCAEAFALKASFSEIAVPHSNQIAGSHDLSSK